MGESMGLTRSSMNSGWLFYPGTGTPGLDFSCGGFGAPAGSIYGSCDQWDGCLDLMILKIMQRSWTKGQLEKHVQDKYDTSTACELRWYISIYRMIHGSRPNKLWSLMFKSWVSKRRRCFFHLVLGFSVEPEIARVQRHWVYDTIDKLRKGIDYGCHLDA